MTSDISLAIALFAGERAGEFDKFTAFPEDNLLAQFAQAN